MPSPTSSAPPVVLDLTGTSIELTRQLCDIESVSGNERAVTDAIEAALSGFTHLELIRSDDALVARTRLGRDKRVLIAGHVDTVPVNRNLPTRYETDRGVDYLWGRGTVDMKAGVAVQVKLAAELMAPPVDITWIWYDHEEVSESLNGLGRLARQHPDLLVGDFAILGEPTSAEVEGGCNGNLRAEVRTFGLRAHSARAWVGRRGVRPPAAGPARRAGLVRPRTGRRHRADQPVEDLRRCCDGRGRAGRAGRGGR